MLIKRLSSLFLFFVCIVCFLAGCTININLGSPAKDMASTTDNKIVSNHAGDSDQSKKTVYECRANICITKTSANTTISSSDLGISKSLIETFNVILQSHVIQNKIHEQYPNTEYTLILEPVEETSIFTIVATSENSDQLDAICNKAASLFCEKSAAITEGYSYKIVDYAKVAQLIEGN
jgi:hypothetical protein